MLIHMLLKTPKDMGNTLPKPHEVWTSSRLRSGQWENRVCLHDTKTYDTLFGHKSDDQGYPLVPYALLIATVVSNLRMELPTRSYGSSKKSPTCGHYNTSGDTLQAFHTSLCSATCIQQVCEVWQQSTYKISRNKRQKIDMLVDGSSLLLFVLKLIKRPLKITSVGIYSRQLDFSRHTNPHSVQVGSSPTPFLLHIK